MEDENRDQAFERIYRQYHQEVLAYCVRRVPPADAFDAAADVFLIAWRRLDEVPAGERALLWLYGVAHRVVANQWRSRRRWRGLKRKLGWLAGEPPSDPEMQLVHREEERQVIDAARRLGREDREILLLRVWEELRPEQIAQTLGISRAAVDQRLHRANRRLAREFDRLDEKGQAIPQPRGDVA